MTKYFVLLSRDYDSEGFKYKKFPFKLECENAEEGWKKAEEIIAAKKLDGILYSCFPDAKSP